MSSFKFETPQESIGLQFWQLHSQWQKRIASALSPHDVNHTQFVILATILWYQDQSIQPSQAEITKITNIEKMTLSKAIARLEGMLLVTRVKSTVDTRSINVSLTEKARELLPMLVRAVEQVDNEIFAIKDSKNKMLFASILTQLNAKK